MSKRKYRVTSRSSSLGRPSGTVFEVEVRDGKIVDGDSVYSEEDLVQRGALERVKRGEEQKEDKPEEK